MQVKRIAECSKEQSAILSTFIKLSFVIKIFVLSIFKWLLHSLHCMGLDVTKPVFEVSDKWDSNQSSQLQILQKIETFLVASLDMTNKRISQALIWLRACTCWFSPLLFANPDDRFYRVRVRIMVEWLDFCLSVTTALPLNMNRTHMYGRHYFSVITCLIF